MFRFWCFLIVMLCAATISMARAGQPEDQNTNDPNNVQMEYVPLADQKTGTTTIPSQSEEDALKNAFDNLSSQALNPTEAEKAKKKEAVEKTQTAAKDTGEKLKKLSADAELDQFFSEGMDSQTSSQKASSSTATSSATSEAKATTSAKDQQKTEKALDELMKKPVIAPSVKTEPAVDATKKVPQLPEPSIVTTPGQAPAASSLESLLGKPVVKTVTKPSGSDVAKPVAADVKTETKTETKLETKTGTKTETKTETKTVQVPAQGAKQLVQPTVSSVPSTSAAVSPPPAVAPVMVPVPAPVAPTQQGKTPVVIAPALPAGPGPKTSLVTTKTTTETIQPAVPAQTLDIPKLGDIKQDVQNLKKADTKVETKTETKTQVKTENKPDEKQQAKSEIKTEVKAQTKTASPVKMIAPVTVLPSTGPQTPVTADTLNKAELLGADAKGKIELPEQGASTQPDQSAAAAVLEEPDAVVEAKKVEKNPTKKSKSKSKDKSKHSHTKKYAKSPHPATHKDSADVTAQEGEGTNDEIPSTNDVMPDTQKAMDKVVSTRRQNQIEKSKQKGKGADQDKNETIVVDHIVTPPVATSPSGEASPAEKELFTVTPGSDSPANGAAAKPMRGNNGADAAAPAKAVKPMELSISESKEDKAANKDLDLAYQAYQVGQYEAAAKLYGSAVKTSPDNEQALFGLGTVYHQMKNYRLAQEYYSKVLKINPNHSGALNNLLAVLTEDNPSAAIAELNRLETVSPGNSAIMAHKGVVYAKMGDNGKANEYFKRAITLEADNTDYVYNYAVFLDKSGHREEARQQYSRLLELNAEGKSLPIPAHEIHQRLTFLSAK
ncbi:MAG: tetratricopeptide repeat protein [Alphaproteobacteria bacterium]|nr:tetratricopeptide repeat protein [Alphaproteobacteria bacterium]